MKSLLRHYGFRRIAAHLIGLVVGCGSFVLLEYLPSDDRWWTHPEMIVVDGLQDGMMRVVLVAWLYIFVRPWMAKRGWFGQTVNLVVLVALPYFIWGLIECAHAAMIAVELSWSSLEAVAIELLQKLAVPMVVIWIPQIWLEICEQLKATPFLRRWFQAHRGHIASWILAVHFRQFIRPLPSNPDAYAGQLGKGIFVGRTLFEDDGIGGQEVFIYDNAHSVVCAATGGGKHITHEAHLASLHQGSGIFISPKPSLADLTLGRRVDPRIFLEGRFAEHERGINPAGISQCRYHIPNSRAFVLGSNQSVYPACRYGFLNDIDFTKDSAWSRLMALARGSFPDRPKNCSTDPWFVLTARTLFASVCGYVCLTDPNPAHRTLPWIAERTLGIDPKTGIASPKYFESLLKQILQCNGMNGLLQTGASNIYNLGEKAFGSIFSETANGLSWMLDSTWRKQLSGSDFSFHWVGEEESPVTVYIIPRQGRAAFQEDIPWLRTISEMSLEILANKEPVPKTPTLFVGDEYRQWGEDISAVKYGFVILRSSNVKLVLYVQSHSQLIEMFGEHGAAEIESSSTMTYFAVNDILTAERISRRLGKHSFDNGRGGIQATDVLTPAEVSNQLRLTSPLAFTFPAGAAPMRLERVAFKPLRLNDGGRYNALPLDGHFDDGLTRESFYGTIS
ncbi:hypothetical protein C5Y96_00015 [Blastopirellula marina]|uniref:TraD/TraG TraM recognition site domain-containing protein n=1 Tax=Blastopirellula marina TaxID=124 RepID=A0A2S8GCI3_9BACT|nr:MULTISPECIES: type IV secretory system conjugative DNA transfer family protein [Pirellulaceae]PQO41794.1 hypothetical protein C5Y96_00015 [Blastopirellula marina]RCS56346.1 hypothetical protein DTL36_00015 [Bremerella cremea]